MKFINAEGEIQEGTPLTELQLDQHEQIRKYLHEKVCGGSYHGAWDRRNTEVKCETIAHFFIKNFDLTAVAGFSMPAAIADAENENAPKAIQAPPVPAPADDLIF